MEILIIIAVLTIAAMIALLVVRERKQSDEISFLKSKVEMLRASLQEARDRSTGQAREFADLATANQILHDNFDRSLVQIAEYKAKISTLKQRINKLELTQDKAVSKAVSKVEKRYLEHASQWLDHLLGKVD